MTVIIAGTNKHSTRGESNSLWGINFLQHYLNFTVSDHETPKAQSTAPTVHTSSLQKLFYRCD